MFIHIFVSGVGITKTITVHFWLFIKIIVGVVDITKTITVPFGCLITSVGVLGITKTYEYLLLVYSDYCRCGWHN